MINTYTESVLELCRHCLPTSKTISSPEFKSLIFLICFKFKFYLSDTSLFVPQVQLVSRLTLFRLSPLFWLGFCNHFNLACFLSSNNLSTSHQTMAYTALTHNNLDQWCTTLFFQRVTSSNCSWLHATQWNWFCGRSYPIKCK